MTARPVSRWRRGVIWALESFGAVLLLVALLDMLLQVGTRAVAPDLSPAWTEEAMRLSLVWITFVGASAATLRRLHLVIELFPNLPSVPRRIWDFVIAALIGAVAVGLLYGAVTLVRITSASTLPGLGWPGSMFYIPLLIFGTVVVAEAVSEAVRAVRGQPIPHQAPEEALEPSDRDR